MNISFFIIRIISLCDKFNLSLLFYFYFSQFADEMEKEFELRDKDMKYEDRILSKLTPLSPPPLTRTKIID